MFQFDITVIIPVFNDENNIYPSSFKLPLCWLHSLTPVT